MDRLFENNKTKPLEIDVPADPIKTLETYLSNNRDKNNNLNFYLKIQKMETKLNIWLSRDLTLMGRTLLAKTLGVSKLVYAASMLTVPQEVIKRVQTKLFNFLWENKKDKIKREVLFQETSKGGLNFPNFATTVKALRLSWIVTKKELKRFKIADNEECIFCNSADSLEHAFLECPAGLKLFQEALTWFNNKHKVNFTPSKQQYLFKDYDPPPNTNSK